MSIHENTVFGFLVQWGRTANVDHVSMAVGILLGQLAKRGVESRLEAGGHGFTFSKDGLDHIEESLRAMLDRRTTLPGMPAAGEARGTAGENPPTLDNNENRPA